MAQVEKTVLVGYSAAQMFRLVDSPENYREFLPWCGGADLKQRDENTTVATLHIDYHGMKQHVTTANVLVPGESIDMRLVSGPFRKLHGAWRFQALGENAAKVEFSLAYEISSGLLARLVGPVFNHIASTMMDAFLRRADALAQTK